MSAAPLVVEIERSGIVESSHLVDVVVISRQGSVVASAGEPATIAYMRSTAKPVQTAVCIDAGWKPPNEEAVAIACGSHNGEPPQVAVVRTTLEAGFLDEAELRCPPAHPRAGAVGDPKPIFHNCSGKHAAMLATAVINGWPRDDYRSPDHPLQRAVAERLSSLAGKTAESVGVDGCGVPTFAYRLQDAGRIFALLKETAPYPVYAMRAQPYLVAGTGRLCTAVLESVPGVVIKVGAEGMFCGALLDDGIGFALKARDGAVRAAEAAVLETLRFLGAEVPADLAPAPVLGGGEPVGMVRMRGELSRA
ncbi:MAG: asparaginase [Actinomycetota bacterium]